MNIAGKRLPSAIPITGRRAIHVSEQCIVCCIAFRLLYRITVSVHDSVGVYCTDSGLCGLFSPPPPKKPLIQSRYTHISECFLLARLRRRIKENSGSNNMMPNYSPHTDQCNGYRVGIGSMRDSSAWKHVERAPRSQDTAAQSTSSCGAI